MTQGPENRMLNRLKPKLEADLGVYIEKTNNPYHSGTPDWYIERDCANGWIEAKFWNIKTNKREAVSAFKLMSKCTTLQERWLRRAAENHSIRAAVLCGFPDTKKFAFLVLPAPYADVDINLQVDLVDYRGLVWALNNWLGR